MTTTRLLALAIALLISPLALAEPRGGCQASSDSTELLGQELLIGADKPFCEDVAIDMAGFPITTKTTYCYVDCGDYAVGCSSEGVCAAYPRNCASGFPGVVFCDPFFTACPSCECINDDTRLITGSGCCCNYDEDPDNPTLQGKVLEQTCVNGYWVTTGFNCGGPSCQGPACEV